VSRKSIRKLEKIFSQENIRGIKKDCESGKYRLVTQSVTREHNSGDIKSGEVSESKELYVMCEKKESTVHFSYEDINGLQKSVYLKLSE
tara:strand:+ start:497 stop:763 length:267 start_codon:yes stop_codon:yes gene_type:complete